MERVLSAGRFGIRHRFGNAGQDYGCTVGKLGYEREIPAHYLDGLSQGGKQDIAALLKARNAILSDAEGFCHAYLRKFPRAPEFPQGHLLRDQFCRAGLDLLALRGIQRTDDVVHIPGHPINYGMQPIWSGHHIKSSTQPDHVMFQVVPRRTAPDIAKMQ